MRSPQCSSLQFEGLNSRIAYAYASEGELLTWGVGRGGVNCPSGEVTLAGDESGFPSAGERLLHPMMSPSGRFAYSSSSSSSSSSS